MEKDRNGPSSSSRASNIGLVFFFVESFLGMNRPKSAMSFHNNDNDLPHYLKPTTTSLTYEAIGQEVQKKVRARSANGRPPFGVAKNVEYNDLVYVLPPTLDMKEEKRVGAFSLGPISNNDIYLRVRDISPSKEKQEKKNEKEEEEEEGKEKKKRPKSASPPLKDPQAKDNSKSVPNLPTKKNNMFPDDEPQLLAEPKPSTNMENNVKDVKNPKKLLPYPNSDQLIGKLQRLLDPPASKNNEDINDHPKTDFNNGLPSTDLPLSKPLKLHAMENKDLLSSDIHPDDKQDVAPTADPGLHKNGGNQARDIPVNKDNTTLLDNEDGKKEDPAADPGFNNRNKPPSLDAHENNDNTSVAVVKDENNEIIPDKNDFGRNTKEPKSKIGQNHDNTTNEVKGDVPIIESNEDHGINRKKNLTNISEGKETNSDQISSDQEKDNNGQDEGLHRNGRNITNLSENNDNQSGTIGNDDSNKEAKEDTLLRRNPNQPREDHPQNPNTNVNSVDPSRDNEVQEPTADELSFRREEKGNPPLPHRDQPLLPEPIPETSSIDHTPQPEPTKPVPKPNLEPKPEIHPEPILVQPDPQPVPQPDPEPRPIPVNPEPFQRQPSPTPNPELKKPDSDDTPSPVPDEPIKKKPIPPGFSSDSEEELPTPRRKIPGIVCPESHQKNGKCEVCSLFKMEKKLLSQICKSWNTIQEIHRMTRIEQSSDGNIVRLSEENKVVLSKEISEITKLSAQSDEILLSFPKLLGIEMESFNCLKNMKQRKEDPQDEDI
jgi:hypothetical protein